MPLLTTAAVLEALKIAGYVQTGVNVVKIIKGDNMADGQGGFDIMRFIAELLPGEQPFLGESRGATGPLAALGNAVGALIPGIQTHLGEGVPGLPAGAIAKSWHTGTAQFFLLTDGRIAAQRKNGTYKIYRPHKSIVVPRNPRIGTLIAADKRIDKLMKGLTRRLPANRKRSTRSRVNITDADVRALQRLLPAGRG